MERVEYYAGIYNADQGRHCFFTGSSSQSNWSERMTIINNGNVGIGTTNPASKLHIKQTDSATDCILTIEADGGTGSNQPFTGIEFIAMMEIHPILQCSTYLYK